MATEVGIRGVDDGEAEQVSALWHASGVVRPWNDPTGDIRIRPPRPALDRLGGLGDGR